MALAVFDPASSPAQEAAASPLSWSRGPATAAIGDNLAEIELDEGFVYLDAKGARQFLELNENPTNGSEMAIVAPVSDAEQWFLVFEWNFIGYVKDDEADSLDADAILTSIRQGNEAANEER